eukprot:8048709-Pyramimonas_sp.AAC.1
MGKRGSARPRVTAKAKAKAKGKGKAKAKAKPMTTRKRQAAEVPIDTEMDPLYVDLFGADDDNGDAPEEGNKKDAHSSSSSSSSSSDDSSDGKPLAAKVDHPVDPAEVPAGDGDDAANGEDDPAGDKDNPTGDGGTDAGADEEAEPTSYIRPSREVGLLAEFGILKFPRPKPGKAPEGFESRDAYLNSLFHSMFGRLSDTDKEQLWDFFDTFHPLKYATMCAGTECPKVVITEMVDVINAIGGKTGKVEHSWSSEVDASMREFIRAMFPDTTH